MVEALSGMQGGKVLNIPTKELPVLKSRDVQGCWVKQGVAFRVEATPRRLNVLATPRRPGVVVCSRARHKARRLTVLRDW